MVKIIAGSVTTSLLQESLASEFTSKLLGRNSKPSTAPRTGAGLDLDRQEDPGEECRQHEMHSSAHVAGRVQQGFQGQQQQRRVPTQ